MKFFQQILLPVLVLGIFIGLSYIIYSSKPKPPHIKKIIKKPSIELMTVQLKQRTKTIELRGIAEPRRTITLTPQVAGVIIYVDKNLFPGKLYKKNDLLYKIEPRDYQYALEKTVQNLNKLKNDLIVELGQQSIVSEELKLSQLEKSLTKEQKNLALRKPQLQRLKASIEEAKANVKQAELNLERCKIKAPFNLIITVKSAEIGKQVSSRTQLITAISSDNLQLKMSVYSKDVTNINLKTTGIATAENRPDCSWEAHFDKFLPEVEKEGLLPQVLMIVKKPFDVTPNKRLLIGSYVTVEVKNKMTKKTAKLPTTALQRGEVWVYNDGKLTSKKIAILWNENNYFICNGLSEGDKVLISKLPGVRENMEVEISKE